MLNDTAWEHAWITHHPNWYLRHAAGTMQRSPDTNFTDLAQLNFSSQFTCARPQVARNLPGIGCTSLRQAVGL
jgi:hypothetical protein